MTERERERERETETETERERRDRQINSHYSDCIPIVVANI